MTTRQRRPIVAGNWKMNGTGADLDEARAIAEAAGDVADHADVILCPPATLIPRVDMRCAGTPLLIGGQDCHAAEKGAHTGDISAEMLLDAGAVAVILGHSERRTNHDESSLHVRAKAEAARRAGLISIICVGETETERKGGYALTIVEQQIKRSVPTDSHGGNTVVAYEPVWAIGTGLTPSIRDISEMHGAIRHFLADHLGQDEAQAIRILYGGSVKPSNADDILAARNVDGALVGGASLKAADLAGIMQVYANEANLTTTVAGTVAGISATVAEASVDAAAVPYLDDLPEDDYAIDADTQGAAGDIDELDLAADIDEALQSEEPQQLGLADDLAEIDALEKAEALAESKLSTALKTASALDPEYVADEALEREMEDVAADLPGRMEPPVSEVEAAYDDYVEPAFPEVAQEVAAVDAEMVEAIPDEDNEDEDEPVAQPLAGSAVAPDRKRLKDITEALEQYRQTVQTARVGISTTTGVAATDASDVQPEPDLAEHTKETTNVSAALEEALTQELSAEDLSDAENASGEAEPLAENAPAVLSSRVAAFRAVGDRLAEEGVPDDFEERVNRPVDADGDPETEHMDAPMLFDKLEPFVVGGSNADDGARPKAAPTVRSIRDLAESIGRGDRPHGNDAEAASDETAKPAKRKATTRRVRKTKAAGEDG